MQSIREQVLQLVEVWRDRKTRTYKIQPWVKLAPTGGGWGRIGGPTATLDESEFDARIGAIVLEELDRSADLVYDAARAPKLSAKEAAAFARTHDGVSVSRLNSGELKVTPLERSRGGYRSVDDAICRLSIDEAPGRLRDVITEAFKHTG
jgi:hypothetical protein